MLNLLRVLPIVSLAAILCSGCEREVILAAANGDLQTVQKWAAGGGNVNITSRDGGVTVLHHAAGIGHVEMVKYLLENKADYTLKGTGCGTPLQWAARAGHVETAKLIVQYGANVNDTGPNDSTALHDAAGKGHLSMVQYLMSNGANVNAVADYGLTPLHGAVLGDHIAIVRVLLNHGVDVTAEFNGRPAPQLTKSDEIDALLREDISSK